MQDTFKPRKQDEAIVDALKQFPKGITVIDFCAATGMLVQSVSGRMGSLHKAGLVQWNGRRKSHTGYSGRVWFAQ